MRNSHYEQQPGSNRYGDDRSTRTRLAARAIDCGEDCVHDGEMEPPPQDAVPAAASPEHERKAR